MINLTAPLIELLDSNQKLKESEIFEKYVFKAIEYCLKKTSSIKPEILKKEIDLLFSEEDKEAWKKTSDKFYNFDDDIYLKADSELTKDQKELKSDYIRLMAAVQVNPYCAKVIAIGKR